MLLFVAVVIIFVVECKLSKNCKNYKNCTLDASLYPALLVLLSSVCLHNVFSERNSRWDEREQSRLICVSFACIRLVSLSWKNCALLRAVAHANLSLRRAANLGNPDIEEGFVSAPFVSRHIFAAQADSGGSRWRNHFQRSILFSQPFILWSSSFYDISLFYDHHKLKTERIIYIIHSDDLRVFPMQCAGIGTENKKRGLTIELQSR